MDPILPPGHDPRTGNPEQKRQEPPAPSEPPSISDSLEGGLRALFQPGAVFGSYARMPAPAVPQTMLCILFWAGCGLVLALAGAMQQISGVANAGPLLIAGFLLGGLILSIPGAFISAGVLHALALLSGGKEGFSRSFQITGLLGVILPAGALTLFIPFQFAWLLPTLYLTFLAVRAVERMHDAPGGQAWLIIGCFGCLAAGGELLFHKAVLSLQYRLESMATLASTADDAAELLGKMQGGPSGAPPPLTLSDGMPAVPGSYPAQAGAPNPYGGTGMPPGGSGPGPDASPQQVIQSSLDMLRSGTFAPQPGTRGPSDAQVQQLFQMGQAMSRAAQQALDANPEALKGLPPEQQRMVRQLLGQVDGMAQGTVGQKEMTQTLQQFLQSVQGTGGFKVDAKKMEREMMRRGAKPQGGLPPAPSPGSPE